jgi:putative transposase
MPRVARIQTAGTYFHILNRANSKLKIFRKQIDYEEFIQLIIESLEKYKIDIYAYILMPTHWHIICSAQVDGEISRWMAWLQMMHTRSWHRRYKTIGRGHFYQGRYKSFIIQEDVYFLQVCRYVERNALRAGLVLKAEDWKWSSLFPENKVKISNWPISKPKNYLGFVNENITNLELESIRESIVKNKPYGEIKWVKQVAKINNIEQSLRKPGRQRGR